MAGTLRQNEQKTEISYGGYGSEPGKFNGPRGVVVSPSNEICVVDEGNRRVQVHNAEGVYLRHFPTVLPGTMDNVMLPCDISIDGNGTLWVVGYGESADHAVQYSKDGAAMIQFDLPKATYLHGIAVDMRNNHILVTDGHLCEVQVFRPDGSLVQRFGQPESDMRQPGYITVDGEGNILVSDYVRHAVYKYDESGKFLLKCGGRGRREGKMKYPAGICTDSSGHIIVADTSNRRIQIFTSHGEYVRHIGADTWTVGVALGPNGQLVLTNSTDHTVTSLPTY